MISHKTAQSLGEYVLVLGIISGALIAMFTYFKRGVQATVKISVDELANQTGENLAGGIIEVDYKPGMERSSGFTIAWEKKENVVRYSGGNQTKTILKDQSSYYGGSIWEAEDRERPFWEDGYKKPQKPAEPSPPPNQEGGW